MNKILIAFGVVSLFVISMSAFAHHGTQISYDMNKAIATADGYCLCNNGGGGAIPRQGVDENQRYQQ